MTGVVKGGSSAKVVSTTMFNFLDTKMYLGLILEFRIF